MTPIVAIDTETTGVHPDRQVWEVAMIRRDDRGKQGEISFFVEVDLSGADPFGLSIGRFYERHPLGRALSLDPDRRSGAKARLPELAAWTVAEWTHGAHLIGAVPNFDADVLDKLLRKHSLIPAWHYHLIDVEALAVGYLAGAVVKRAIDEAHMRGDEPPQVDWSRFQPPWKSDELSRACGVEPPGDDERHTALGDARWALRLYDAIMGWPPS